MLTWKDGRYESVEELGAGFYGKVYKVKDTHDKVYRAVKQIQVEVSNTNTSNHETNLNSFDCSVEKMQISYDNVNSNHDQNLSSLVSRFEKIQINKDSENMLKEARLLKRAKSPFIIGYVDFFIEKDFYYIVTELANGGDLEKSIAHCKRDIRNNIGQPFSVETVHTWTEQLLKGTQ